MMTDFKLVEGQFYKDKVNGFGRVIYATGAYYIGWMRNNEKHGFGKYVLADGTVKEGTYFMDDDHDQDFIDHPIIGKEFNEKDYIIEYKK